MRLGDLDALKNEIETWGCNDFDKYDFIEAIDNAPTVEPTFGVFKSICCEDCDKNARPQGEWIKKVDNVGFISHICSKCGAEIEVENPCDNKFCFNCGASMKKGGEE